MFDHVRQACLLSGAVMDNIFVSFGMKAYSADSFFFSAGHPGV